MNALELTAFGLFGMVLTVATVGVTSPAPFVSVAGGMGIPLEEALREDAPPTRYASTARPEMVITPPSPFARTF